jgi:hypothetical protein
MSLEVCSGRQGDWIQRNNCVNKFDMNKQAALGLVATPSPPSLLRTHMNMDTPKMGDYRSRKFN